jgi:hypothetical protein
VLAVSKKKSSEEQLADLKKATEAWNKKSQAQKKADSIWNKKKGSK